jgi:lantibiotic modifying enzyme
MSVAMKPGWQPLLEDICCSQAREIIGSLARELRDWTADPMEVRHPGWKACVASGEAGLALFFAYLALTKLDENASSIAVGFLGKAMDRVADEAMNASLYCGFTGVAWTIAHLQKQLLATAGDATGAIDDALQGFLAQSPWHGDFDLINGLVGIGVYALERLPDPVGVRLLERIVDCLEELSTMVATGRTWWTEPSWLPEKTREEHPQGYNNLGLAHGTPGIIGLLGAACAAGVQTAKARALLADAIPCLLAQECQEAGWVGFPSWTGPGPKSGRSRLAWCYGDLGIAVVLLSAARAVGDSAWEEKALAIARRAANCPLERSGVQDACVCHGATGAGHLFNRLHQATADTLFAQAARCWFQRAVQMRVPQRGIAGYAALWGRDEQDREEWKAEAGFLMGAAGIGLALLAAITPVEPSWDRLLLIDLPPGKRPS